MRIREAGILLPVFSLPGKYGIGTLGKSAREFVDRLADSGQNIWQILPLCPAGYGASPYSSYSTHAGNPLFMDIEMLLEDGWVEDGDLRGLQWGSDAARVDYEAVGASSAAVLRRAFVRRQGFWKDHEYQDFAKHNSWLEDFGLFMALKEKFGGISLLDWPAPFRDRDAQTIRNAREELREEVAYHCFVQWLFQRQWDALHDYAKARQVKILGDIPIYVSLDSVDTWVNPTLFQLRDDKQPDFVAGVPPDGFSAVGQVWGNPLYDWNEHRNQGFEWWLRRVETHLKRVDMLRIDHFRGLESYFAIPAGAPSAAAGHWEQGPGMEFFTRLAEHIGPLPFVLEDLGYLTEEVIRLREETQMPGIQLIQFAFDSREPGSYWPYAMSPNSVVYTGTHDNDTVRGWLDALAPADLAAARTYTATLDTPLEDLTWVFITLAMTAVADTCIIPMGDYLGLGSEGRINVPSQAEGNWSWRMTPEQLQGAPWDRIRQLTQVSGRETS